MERSERILKYSGSIIDVYQDVMTFEDGKKEYWDFVHHRNGAAAVLPVLDDGRIILVKQYRPSIERFSIELPAGAKTSPEESSYDCAVREMEEEIGYIAQEVSLLMNATSAGAFCSENLDIYLARGLKKTHNNLDEHEYIEVEYLTMDDIKGLIKSGKMHDAKTIAAVMTYASFY